LFFVAVVIDGGVVDADANNGAVVFVAVVIDRGVVDADWALRGDCIPLLYSCGGM
jgi:hypothetical protein